VLVARARVLGLLFVTDAKAPRSRAPLRRRVLTAATATDSRYPLFDDKTGDVRIDYFDGYRKLEHDDRTPAFWFGAGLSYDTYTYSNLNVVCSGGTVAKNAVLNGQVTVKNNGKMPSTEVVPIYIGYPNTQVRRPVKELKAFLLVALQAGESKS
jgi:fibronectin type III domain protein